MKIRFAYVLTFALAALLLPSVARADGSSIYEISGSMVFTGNAGQIETINFDFDLGFTPCGSGCDNRGPWLPEVVGSPTSSGTGDMGNFQIGAWQDYEDFVGFYDAESDEVDLRFPQVIDSALEPTIATGEIYRCNGPICATEFNVLNPSSPYYPGGVNYAVTTLTVTDVTPTPEPTSFALLLFGIAAIFCAQKLTSVRDSRVESC